MIQIKIYSFFSGCGLLDLGMEKAGFDIAMVSEKYEPFLNAYKYSRDNMKMKKPEHGYFNDDICDYLKEARRYYTNIVGKYGVQVQALLKKLKTLEIIKIGGVDNKLRIYIYIK